MNPCTAVTTLIALTLFWNQSDQMSWEKRAVDDTKRIPASELDAELPKVSFAEWFGMVLQQPSDAVIWQLGECGEETEAKPNGGNDLKACVEANTILKDGRRVIVRVAVGTFKQGMTGAPTFQFGVIDQKSTLRQIRKLRDLHALLLNPDKLPDRPIVNPPKLNMESRSSALKKGPTPVTLINIGEGLIVPIEDLDAEPPPKPPEPPKPPAALSQGAPIKKPQPTYPRTNGAKRFNASGDVQVQVTIGITGRVTGARAVTGHPLLRDAAVAAARQWEFEPTTVNGVPMETQLVLTFTFTIPPE